MRSTTPSLQKILSILSYYTASVGSMRVLLSTHFQKREAGIKRGSLPFKQCKMLKKFELSFIIDFIFSLQFIM